MSADFKILKIHHARENNLKDVSLDIEHDKLSVVTGLSGSGKSSLAFETVYAEGQRRYIETFSPYTRQFFDKVKKPAVDLIENVRPAIAIQQRTRVLNSRSTVGSMTNINDYLKILWSNLAQPFCPSCGLPLQRWDAYRLSQHIAEIISQSSAARFLIATALAPKKLAVELERLTVLGFSRFLNRQSGEIISIQDSNKISLDKNGELIVVLDRLKPATALAENTRNRLKDSIEQAFSLSSQITSGSQRGGCCLLIEVPSENSTTLPEKRFYNFITCQICAVGVEAPRPSLFSYNHPIGACSNCNGFGRILLVDSARCVPNPLLSIDQKALTCWAGEGTRAEFRRLLNFCVEQKIPIDLPWQDLLAAQQDLVLNHKSKKYIGVFPWFKRLERKIYKMHVRVFLAKYRSQSECPECQGTRLKSAALAYRIDGKRLPDIWEMPIITLRTWLESVAKQYDKQQAQSLEIIQVLKATLHRLRYLDDLGLSYLTLNRAARTLSGGETQRVNLASALGSELVSTHFVLDEPSVGLHARDTDRLIKSIRDLQQRGNSLLIVEHDLGCINEADQVIEVGPLAGSNGGQIVYNGPAEKWPGFRITPHLNSKFQSNQLDSVPVLEIKNARARNLKGLNLRIPLSSQIVCLSGVSGSGKSTLVHEVLETAYNNYSKAQQAQSSFVQTSDLYDSVNGFENISQMLLVDQSPLAKSPRGNIGTYSGIWELIRELLASSDDALSKGLSRSAFSFNVEGGRCPACNGAGFIREDMQFLSDVYIPCDVCLGKRFQQTVLEVRYRGLSVDQYLQLSIDSCATQFKDHPRISSLALTLQQLGLGHLTIGHPLSELSGGEAQRLRLVPFIEQSSQGPSLLIFDEPTTGLHFLDVERLIALFRVLTSKGHSILCVEHNLSILAAADRIIDLGPEAGDEGGQIVLEGSPADFVKAAKDLNHPSFTARYLSEYLQWLETASAFKPEKRSKSLSIARATKAKSQALSLEIRGARQHNLKNIDLDIPLQKFVALTGVSGSGKSSIAKDIIYAEGQRRYLDCLSPYARQFIKELKKPEITSIRNIMPTICVYQHTFQPSRLSTLGTMSEVYNYLRLLFAKTAVQYCPEHPDQAISPMSAESIAEEIKRTKAQSIRLLASVIKKKKGSHREVLDRAIRSEISQIRVDGVFLSPSSVSMSGGLEKSKPHSIDFVVAKFNPASIDQQLIQEAVAQALGLSGGTVMVLADRSESIYSLERTCPICKRGFFKPDPEDLSFSSKRGACPSCSGTGHDEKGKTCAACKGSRINELGQNLRLGTKNDNKNIYELCLLTAPELEKYLNHLRFDSAKTTIAEHVLLELKAKLRTLTSVGLDYIELNRSCNSLSGGELQRLRLSAAMGSPLSGVLYILDEPSAGLHPIDNQKVLAKISELKQSGNSVLMIEHDSESIQAAEHVIDIGPGGGSAGGQVVFNGSIDKFMTSEESPTAQAIRQELPRVEASNISPTKKEPVISIRGAEFNNIKNLSLKIPLGKLICIAGVSGAGKSSLVHGILAKNLDAEAKHSSIVTSDIEIERVLVVDQNPIGINSRSTPASYLGIWDEIRSIYASTVEARARGFTASYFSYNTGKGRCPECKGQGQIKLEMNFLPDAQVDCQRCAGSRFTEDAQSVLYLGRSISQTLQLTFEEARIVFANHRRIHRPLTQACELGLGYLTLGQSSSSLSGGESQRIKLVSELNAQRSGHSLYLLDEPTTGLHKLDVEKLIKTLKSLVERGGTVIVIEHDRDLILHSEHVIELGPGAGVAGGNVVFQGAASSLFQAKTPWGGVLRQQLGLQTGSLEGRLSASK